MYHRASSEKGYAAGRLRRLRQDFDRPPPYPDYLANGATEMTSKHTEGVVLKRAFALPLPMPFSRSILVNPSAQTFPFRHSMPNTPALFSRPTAVLILACLAFTFASNHVAARLAFDDGTGVLLAVLFRSGTTLLVLTGLLLIQRQSWRLPAGSGRWQLLLGLLIATQSLCLYSAVARIPVALALLVANVFPILLALLTWVLGGAAPGRRTLVLMGLILFGLVLALNIPVLLSGAPISGEWLLGVGLAFCGACSFATALWITDHKLGQVPGALRSSMTMLVVFGATAVIGAGDLMPNGLAQPATSSGWWALAALAVLYGTGFSLLFVLFPRLDMAHNTPVLNIEPVASLLLGWLILDQMLAGIQLLGGALVLAGIILLSLRRG